MKGVETMAEYESKRQRPRTKKEQATYLLNCVNKWIREGATPEKALERLTVKQYDLLCDYEGDYLDKLTMTTEQIADTKKLLREGAGRQLFPNGYNKKYPKDKQELYKKIVDFLAEQGADIKPREKENYRDIDFSVNGKNYKIIMSCPRG